MVEPQFLKNENISRVMSSNKSKNTKPELLLRKLLWKNGIKGYRLHWKNSPGRPDIAFPGRKKAIFVNGCFWHRCKKCYPHLPKTNIEFWKNKFEKNEIRDKKKIKDLKDSGWDVITIWECDLKNDVNKVLEYLKIFYKIEKSKMNKKKIYSFRYILWSWGFF